MKGIQGLVIAIVLGVLGACVNMYYLYKGRTIETVDFIGVREGAKIMRGKRISSDQLVPVAIPREHVGNLDDFAVRFNQKATIVGRKAVRNFSGSGSELVLLEDLRTPPPHLELKEDEAAIWVTINTGTAITSQIIPGVTPVSFYLPKSRNPASGRSASAEEEWEWVGPFDVLAVGNRLGTLETMRAENISERQQNILTLRANFVRGQLDEKVSDLKAYLRRSNNAPLDVLLHPPVRKKDEA